jgi:hypothetical protein
MTTPVQARRELLTAAERAADTRATYGLNSPAHRATSVLVRDCASLVHRTRVRPRRRPAGTR